MSEPIFLSNGRAGPDVFPGEVLAACAEQVLRTDAARALQYGPRPGFDELRDLVVSWLTAEGVPGLEREHVLIVPGAKHALSVVARALSRPGDRIATSSPTYMTGLGIFRSLDRATVSYPVSPSGFDLDALRGLMTRGTPNDRPRFLYEMPDFHNPTARVMTTDERRELLELSRTHDLPILEDSPYRWLRYDGDPVAPLLAHDTHGRVLSVGSFSKTLAPGLQLAWIVCRGPLLATLKPFEMELIASPLAQLVVLEYFRRVDLADHLEVRRQAYRHKRDVALRAMEEHLGDTARWEVPAGGYYLWPSFDRLHGDHVARVAAEQGVLVYPGSAFFPDDVTRVSHEVRVNYAYETPERVAEGIEILGRVVRELRH